MLIFRIHDTKADSYLQPFFAETQAVALRLLKEPCNDPTHNFCKYGTDYHLYELGYEDPATGDIIGVPKIHITCLNALHDQHLAEGQTVLESLETDVRPAVANI